MFENFVKNDFENKNYVNIFFIVFFLSLFIGFCNYFLNLNFIFFVFFVTLFLSNPIFVFLEKFSFDEIIHNYSLKNIFKKNYEILILFWIIFISVSLSFFLLLTFNIIDKYYFIENIVEKITGNFFNLNAGFFEILLNNLFVGLFTLILSILSVSSFIFILIFNASIFSYFLFSQDNLFLSLKFFIAILPHALFEIGGYFFFGICGFLLSQLISKKYFKKIEYDKNAFKDILFFILIAIIFIVLGAIIESLKF